MTFEEWWQFIINGYMGQLDDKHKAIAQDAFTAGVEEGRRQVNTLPHRAMFDSGYEQGYKEGLARAAEMAENLIEDITDYVMKLFSGVYQRLYETAIEDVPRKYDSAK